MSQKLGEMSFNYSSHTGVSSSYFFIIDGSGRFEN